MRRLVTLAILALLLSSGCRGGPPAPASSEAPSSAPEPALPVATIVVRDADRRVALTVEVAATPADRQRGLMFRDTLAENAGMLFLFPRDTRTGFWMKDTKIPLSIAFIDAGGRVVSIRDGRPFDETIIDPGTEYRYALEVNQGWFERHGFSGEIRVELPEDLPPAR